MRPSNQRSTSRTVGPSAGVGCLAALPPALGVGRSIWLLGAAAVAVFVFAVIGSLRVGDESESEADSRGDAESSSDVWDAIPQWQYTGRHAESGGFSRDEQERALAEIDERAAELEGDRDV